MRVNDDPLSVERIRQARETLFAAFGVRGFPGAVDQRDPAAVFSEAKRNLTALVGFLYGQAEFERLLEEDNRS